MLKFSRGTTKSFEKGAVKFESSMYLMFLVFRVFLLECTDIRPLWYSKMSQLISVAPDLPYELRVNDLV